MTAFEKHTILLHALRRTGRLAVLAASLFALSSCAHEPVRWTPETVAPPVSLASALDAIQSPVAPAPETPPEPATAVEVSANTIEGEAPGTVELTRDGAILTALARNRSLTVERFETDIAATNIQTARAAFDPSVLASALYGESNSPLSSGSGTGSSSSGASSGGTTGTSDLASLSQQVAALSSALSALDQETVATSRRLDSTVKVSEYLPTGTEFYVSGGYARSDSSQADTRDYEGTWALGMSQALLRGAGTAVNLVTLRQSRNSAAASDYAVRDATLSLVESVEYAYWNLVLADETRSIREFSVSLSEEQLKLNEAMISVGKLAESARVSAEASLSSSQADLVDAQAAVRSRSIELWRLMNPESNLAESQVYVPVDAPTALLTPLDTSTSVKLAALYRPELAQARLSLANRELEVVRTKNGLLPRLDFSASYGRSSPGTAVSDATRYLDDDAYDSFQVGLTFEMSLTNRAERAAHRRAKFQQDQAEASVWQLEQVIEAEVRQAVVETDRQWQRIAATEKEVLSREEELRVEQDQFRVGRSTNLDVLQVQAQLIQAKVDEANARVGYIESLTALYRAEGTLLERRGIAVDGTKECER